MFDWIKIIILRYLLFTQELSMTIYKAIYKFLDKFIPDRKSKTEQDDKKDIYDRNDVFSGEKFPDDFWDDDEFMDKEVDDFKDTLSVIIMLIISIAAIVMLIKMENRLYDYIGYGTVTDPWSGTI